MTVSASLCLLTAVFVVFAMIWHATKGEAAIADAGGKVDNTPCVPLGLTALVAVSRHVRPYDKADFDRDDAKRLERKYAYNESDPESIHYVHACDST